MHWTQYIIPVASTISVIVIAVVEIITHRKSSAKFDRIISEEMKLKDEQIRTLESNHEGILAVKNEQINIYELLSSPQIIERYNQKIEGLEKIVEELNAENYELNQKVESLTRQLANENSRRTQAERELAGIKLPKDARSAVSAYIEGAIAGYESIEKSVNAVTTSGEIIQRKAEEFIRESSLEIIPVVSSAATVSDIARAEITDPDEDTLAGVEES